MPLTWISGGTMLGNCATGRASAETSPITTMRMAITIATMGRLMKNRDMVLPPRRLRVRLRIHHGAFAHFGCSFRDHALPGLQAAHDDPHLAGALGSLDGSNADSVVGSDYGHLVASLKLADGPLRNQERTPAKGRHRADSPKLAGAEEVFGIVERSDDPDGAGLRIYLAVREDHGSAMRINISVGERQLERDPAAAAQKILRRIRTEPSRQRQILLFADRKARLDGIHRRDGGENGGGTDQIADLSGGDARDAVDQRAHLRETEIQLRLLDRRLGRLDRGFARLNGALVGFHQGLRLRL